MPRLFDDLRVRLLHAGIAPRHVRRYLKELQDHFQDLLREERDEAAALRRLGNIEELARVMIAQPAFRSWTARLPWATLVLAPAVLLTGVVALSVVFLISIFAAYRTSPSMLSGPLPDWTRPLAEAVTWFDMHALPLFIGWMVAAIAATRRLPAHWPLVGLAIVACLGGAFEVGVVFPTDGTDGLIQVGLGIWPPFPRPAEHLWRAALNSLLLLVPYLALRLRQGRPIFA